MSDFKEKKIAVVTGSRAEYGLLYWLLKKIQSEPGFRLQLIVTGMHFSPEFGYSYQEIIDDGFAVDARVESQLSSDSAVGVAKSVGLGLIGFADAYEALKPDLIFLLGDRFEILAAAQAALFARIPIAHLHGGELTEGAYDDAIRHAITKMSNLHFVAAAPYRQRVIQLGEDPAQVFNVGAIGLDYLKKGDFLDKAKLEKEIEFELGPLNFLVTYHPETLGIDPVIGIQNILKALDHFPQAKIIFTKSNSDEGGRSINKVIDEYVDKNPSRVIAYKNLGSKKYLSLMRIVDLVLGNSSSGIYEAPALGRPVVNIGDRQKGRLRSSLICEANNQVDSIVSAISNALKLNKKNIDDAYPYGNGNAAELIIEKIKEIDFSKLRVKKFFDLRQEIV